MEKKQCGECKENVSTLRKQNVSVFLSSSFIIIYDGDNNNG